MNMEVAAKTSVCWAMFLCLLGTSEAILIQGCNGGWLTVLEGTKQPIICSDIADPLAVAWSIQTSNGSYIFNESCNINTCDYNNGISVSAVSANLTSLLTIQRDHRKYGNLWVICNAGRNTLYRCQINVENVRNYSDCKFYDDGSMITGYCYMEKAFMSNATVYSCQWYLVYSADTATNKVNIPSVLVYTAYEESTLLYYKGICYFSNHRVAANVTVKLDGNITSQEYVGNDSNDSPSHPDQNTTSASLSVEYDDAYPLTLMCSGQPEPTQSYEWSGLVCVNSSQKQNVCSASPSDLTSHQPLVTCTVTSANTIYNGSRIAARFYLQLKNASATSTTFTAAHGSRSPDVQTFTTQITHTVSDKTASASDQTINTGNDDKGDSLPWGAIGGVVGGAFIIIIIVVVIIVICRRGTVSGKPTEMNADDEFDEHVNIVYESGDQENNCTPARPQQAGMNTTMPSYDENQLDDGEIDMGYTTVRLNPIAHAANGTVAGGMTHTNSAPAMRHDVALADTELTDDYDPNYSAVDSQRPKTFPAPSGTSSYGDEYAVVNKSAKGKKGATFQLEVYAHVNKPKSNQAGDVYAEMDRSSKRRNSQVVQQRVNSVDGVSYSEVQIPKPDSKPIMFVKPDLKSTPTLQPYNGTTPGDDSAEQDEYNVLQLGAQAHNASLDDAEQNYSHIQM